MTEGTHYDPRLQSCLRRVSLKDDLFPDSLGSSLKIDYYALPRAYVCITYVSTARPRCDWSTQSCTRPAHDHQIESVPPNLFVLLNTFPASHLPCYRKVSCISNVHLVHVHVYHQQQRSSSAYDSCNVFVQFRIMLQKQDHGSSSSLQYTCG